MWITFVDNLCIKVYNKRAKRHVIKKNRANRKKRQKIYLNIVFEPHFQLYNIYEMFLYKDLYFYHKSIESKK